MTKEAENVKKALQKYVDRYKGNAQVVCSVMAFKGKEYSVIDDGIIVFGAKDTVLMDLKDTIEQVKKEKDDFVSW